MTRNIKKNKKTHKNLSSFINFNSVAVASHLQYADDNLHSDKYMEANVAFSDEHE